MNDLFTLIQCKYNKKWYYMELFIFDKITKKLDNRGKD